MYSKEKNKLKKQMMDMLENGVDEIFTQLEANQLNQSAISGNVCDTVLPKTFDANLNFKGFYGNDDDDYIAIEIVAHPIINLVEKPESKDISAFKKLIEDAECDKDFMVIVHKGK